MKALSLLIISFFFILNASGQENFVLKGKAYGFADSTWLMLRHVDLEIVVDSTQIINNEFMFGGEINGPERFVLSTRYTGSPESHQYKFLWIEPGTIFLEGKSGDFKNAVVKGSKIQEQQEELYRLTRRFEETMDSLNNEYRKGSFSDSVKLDEARKLRNEVQEEERTVNIRFIREHPKYLYSAVTLTYLMKNIEKETTRELYNLLTPEIKATEYGAAVKNYLSLNREFNVGDRYADIELPNAEGETLRLSAFNGKYILLDFWASGCGPCRIEHPQLLELYNKYKDEGFEIFAVSLDKNRENWVKAMKKDQITWPNVSDLQGNNGEAALTYGVSYIPNNYLIDPDGVIIGKDIRGKALEEKVEELFARD